MDYFELCHTDKESDITQYIITDLKAKIEHGFGSATDKKALKMFEESFGSVIAHAGVYWVIPNDNHLILPLWFKKWLASWLKRTYNILPLFNISGRCN